MELVQAVLTFLLYLIITIVVLGVSRMCRYLFILPMNRIRTLNDDIGFKHINGKLKKAAINRLRKSRKVGKIPPPYPNGWYVLAESTEIPIGSDKILHVAALGQNFAVFRGQNSNEAYVLDAYCSHLGADLTAGGKVIGEVVQCCFHEWQFEGKSGKCIKGCPEKARSAASIKSHDCTERNGLIFVWFHADQLPPQWFPLVIDDIKQSPIAFDDTKHGKWVYQGRNEYHVTCHIQDIPENGADPAHLPCIHSSPIFSGGEPTNAQADMQSKLSKHEWKAQWSPIDDEGQTHRAVASLEHKMNLYWPWKVTLFKLDVIGDQIGPSIVHLGFESNSYFGGKAVMIQYILPIEPMLQKVVHVFYTEPKWHSWYAKMVLWGESILFERDVRVWNSKTYPENPIFGNEDKLLVKHRRWFQQFYTNASHTLGRSSHGLDF